MRITASRRCHISFLHFCSAAFDELLAHFPQVRPDHIERFLPAGDLLLRVTVGDTLGALVHAVARVNVSLDSTDSETIGAIAQLVRRRLELARQGGVNTRSAVKLHATKAPWPWLKRPKNHNLFELMQ